MAAIVYSVASQFFSANRFQYVQCASTRRGGVWRLRTTLATFFASGTPSDPKGNGINSQQGGTLHWQQFAVILSKKEELSAWVLRNRVLCLLKYLSNNTMVQHIGQFHVWVPCSHNGWTQSLNTPTHDDCSPCKYITFPLLHHARSKSPTKAIFAKIIVLKLRLSW